MSNVYCIFCWRELRPNDTDGCACGDFTDDDPDTPGNSKERTERDDQEDHQADRDYEARCARGYEREQQLSDQARWGD
jgi:hypothetical protein